MNKNKMIPKRIFYVWFGNKKIPQKFLHYIEGWKKLNPEFEIKRIDESNFNINKYKFTQEAYKAKKWAFVSDVARLDTIYNNGGFYLDTDVKLIKSLDSLRNYKSVWALENSGNINSGLIIGAQQYDKNIKNILKIYKSLSYQKDNEKNIFTVPLISNYFVRKGFKRKNKKQMLIDGTVILPVKYFAPYHYWGGGHITKETIGIHMYAASWTKKTKFLSKESVKNEIHFLMPSLFFMLKRIIKGHE